MESCFETSLKKRGKKRFQRRDKDASGEMRLIERIKRFFVRVVTEGDKQNVSKEYQQLD